MGKINNDYLWLHERPQRHTRLRRLALLLVVPLIIGAAWLSANDTDARADKADTRSTGHAIAERTAGAAYGPSPRASAGGEAATGAKAGTVEVALQIPNEIASDTAVLHIEPSVARAPLDHAAPPANLSPASSSEQAGAAQERAVDKPAWTRIEIRKGDTLSIAFARHELAYADSLAIAHMPEHGERFTRKLRAGDVLKVKAGAQGQVLALNYPLGPTRVLEVRPSDDGFSGAIARANVEHRTAYATGVINTSFYADALEAGLSDRHIMSLAHIFGWDIDFALDTRAGDRFVVVYDELYKDGNKVGNGPILAASFQNRGEDFRAVRYTNHDNESSYYAPDGSAMRKAFIRTPVDYTRISSPFSATRDHPILNTIRGHHGTDYAAPTGTPIRTTGGGRIVFRGRNGGYGNMVKIKHSDRVTTRYGHMSRFASGQGVGSFVEQGETIGYVGSTGLSTGPHLHYEFRVAGEPKDPETVDLPGSPPLPDEYMDDFKQHVTPLLAQLDSLSNVNVALNERRDPQ